MKQGNRVVLGIFSDQNQVELAVGTMKNQGFRNTDISVLIPQGNSKTFGHEKHTKAPEGATLGTSTGAVIGGTLGWLAGIGAIAALPVLGPLVAAGPILAALSGAAVGGAIGGLTGALVGYGIPEYEAKRYEDAVKQGGILLSVHVDDAEWLEKARVIMKNSGAHDISSTREEHGPDRTNRPGGGDYRPEETRGML